MSETDGRSEALRQRLRALIHQWRSEGFDAAQFANQLQAALLADGGGWQPIATAPKDGMPFIAANRMDAFRAFYDLDGEVWTAEDSGLWFGQLKYPPTHWMPLPSHPLT